MGRASQAAKPATTLTGINDIGGVELRDVSSVAAAVEGKRYSVMPPSPESSASASHRFGLDEALRFQKASMYVTNALRGRLTTTDNVKLYTFFHGSMWKAIYMVSVVLLCLLIVFENPSTMWIYLIPDDADIVSIPLGALNEDGTPGPSVPVELSVVLNAVELLLCSVFIYDYSMRREIFRSGDKRQYYK
jgi:hypothetical protein